MNKNLRGRKGQQGFTLIELLVVVTILGILAAIVTLSLVGLTTNASVQACNQEYKTVQAALDAYLADKNLDTIAAATDTNDMTGTTSGSVALYNQNPTPASPNFTRNGKTQFYYSWDVNGRISAIFKDSSGTAAPAGCAVT
jgi:prepilin-type N-terminal cleavage/methylation domain-containing protein